MKTRSRVIALAIATASATVLLTACGPEATKQSDQYDAVEDEAQNREAYIPQNDVEFNNYNRAQELYDSPDSIIWCTTTWGNANSPLVTVPVIGKLTSSSVSYFPNHHIDWDGNGNVLVESQSVDGMYHGTPPGYRYGFTPGGQYVDFFNMATFCTTALTEFQREATAVSITVDAVSENLQAQAEKALADGDEELAQHILEQLSTSAAPNSEAANE